MLKWLETGDWKRAFLEVIPARTGVREKEGKGGKGGKERNREREMGKKEGVGVGVEEGRIMEGDETGDDALDREAVDGKDEGM